MTITVQIDEKGGIPLKEHSDELRAVLKSFAEKEVDISIKESTYFSDTLSESVRLQNKYSESVNEVVKTWTDADFALLRGKMSVVSVALFDYAATAASDKKTTEAIKDRVYHERKFYFLESEKCNVTTASLKARVSDEYIKAENDFLQCYKESEILEMHVSALKSCMNAIAGIQKSGISYLKF
jgi:hypothetical protein